MRELFSIIKITMEDKYQIILENYINGNKTNFRQQLRALPKVQILDFVVFWSQYEMESVEEVISILQKEMRLR